MVPVTPPDPPPVPPEFGGGSASHQHVPTPPAHGAGPSKTKRWVWIGIGTFVVLGTLGSLAQHAASHESDTGADSDGVGNISTPAVTDDQSAETPTEKEFLADVHSRAASGTSGVPDATLWALAGAVCTRMRSGGTFDTAVTALEANGVSASDSDVVVTDSIEARCPEDAGLIP